MRLFSYNNDNNCHVLNGTMNMISNVHYIFHSKIYLKIVTYNSRHTNYEI
jgi:hypothetical protein